MTDTATAAAYATTPTQMITGASATTYAYRDTGVGEGPPLVLLQHFRGNLDNWDPALVDALAHHRRVIAFDNRGVGASSGTTPASMREMALDALDFIDALELDEIDLLGFSIGSFVAQEIALIRPDIVRRIVLASAAPAGAPGIHGWAPDVIGAVGKTEPTGEDYLSVFFTQSEKGLDAGQALLGRIFGARTVDRDAIASWQTRLAQYDAVCSWGEPNHALLTRVTAINKSVFIASGDSDPMIPPRYSYLLAGLIEDAAIKIYPDAAHGFLFEYHAEFADDVHKFLSADA